MGSSSIIRPILQRLAGRVQVFKRESYPDLAPSNTLIIFFCNCGLQFRWAAAGRSPAFQRSDSLTFRPPFVQLALPPVPRPCRRGAGHPRCRPPCTPAGCLRGQRRRSWNGVAGGGRCGEPNGRGLHTEHYLPLPLLPSASRGTHRLARRGPPPTVQWGAGQGPALGRPVQRGGGGVVLGPAGPMGRWRPTDLPKGGQMNARLGTYGTQKVNPNVVSDTLPP